MKFKISVIVPIYNVENYLTKCLDNLINQTYKGIRIICVDDGSTDNSAEILDKFAKEDKRIVVIKKENGGLSSARNAGLKVCDTKYVMFCDSDDYFEREMCEKMLETIEEDDSDLAVCENRMIYLAHSEMMKSDDEYYRLRYYGKVKINDAVILNTNVSMSNKIFRMDMIKKYRLSFLDGMNNEDFYFYNAYMSVSKTISFVHEKLYNYVRRDNSIMSNNFRAENLSVDHLKVAEELFRFYKKNGFLKGHLDLFWRQWVQSYWFSFEHTSDCFKKEVGKIAKSFIVENYKKYPPENAGVKREVNNILARSVSKFSWRNIKRIFVAIYWRLRPSCRRQKRMNMALEKLICEYNGISERLDDLAR